VAPRDSLPLKRLIARLFSAHLISPWVQNLESEQAALVIRRFHEMGADVAIVTDLNVLRQLRR
jgi:hypothetical protein